MSFTPFSPVLLQTSIPHLAAPGFPSTFYFHPFPTAGRCDSKNLGSVACQPFFPFPRRLKRFSRGVFAHGVQDRRLTWLATFFLTHKAQLARRLHRPSSRGRCGKSLFCLQTREVEKGGLLHRPSPYFQRAGNFSAAPFASLGNGLAGRRDYGWARKGQKLKPALHFFIKSRR